jgi:hypothetical protein
MMTTLDNIAKVVSWYGAIPKDYRDIEMLTYTHRRLSVLLFDYAGEVGDLYKQSKGSEYTRKTAFERERLRLIGEGKSAAAAGNEAQTTISELAFAEVCADADYRSALMQYQAAGDVLRAISQHIASMKEERRLEMSGSQT